jgi:Fe-Mn family superoxide dismutase
MISLRSLLREAEQFELTPVKLAFKYNEYSPFDEETMKTHYSKHYMGYIEKANEAIKKESIPVTAGDDLDRVLLAKVGSYSDTFRNNIGGYFNHTIFFNGLNPERKGKIEDGLLLDLINTQFGSFDKFKEAFIEAASKHFGSGWCWLMHHNGQLYFATTPNQDNPYMNIVNIPGDILIGLDLWEHSYYLKYKNDRAKYVNDFFKLVCFESAQARLQKASDTVSY